MPRSFDRQPERLDTDVDRVVDNDSWQAVVRRLGVAALTYRQGIEKGCSKFVTIAFSVEQSSLRLYRTLDPKRQIADCHVNSFIAACLAFLLAQGHDDRSTHVEKAVSSYVYITLVLALLHNHYVIECYMHSRPYCTASNGRSKT